MRLTLLLIVSFAACHSSSNSKTTSSGGQGDLAMNLGGLDDLAVDRDAFYVQDPPVMYCGLDGGMYNPPPPPGGTLECPDDKNLEGCPCPSPGATASCWPGKRANRHLGICMDGTTTCQQATEIGSTWGPCMGAVLPDPNATEGASACKCFSHGFWNVTNLVPCSSGPSITPPVDITSMYSSTLSGGDAGTISCNNMPAAGSSWSDDTVTADCSGHFTLCYTIKAGDGKNPQPTDCVIARSCATGDYTQVNVAQPWPPLPSWISTASTSCFNAFNTTGGYGEMSVSGETVTCDMITEHVFQRVTYCAPGATNCSSGGGGQF